MSLNIICLDLPGVTNLIIYQSRLQTRIIVGFLYEFMIMMAIKVLIYYF